MKRDRTLYLLCGLAVVLAALVLWDRHRPSTDEAARNQQRLLPGFDRANATILVVERGGVTTELRHEAGGWWLANPHRRADDGAVESLLAVLEYGSLERRVPLDEKTRATTGLDHPRVVVRVEGHVLSIGADAPSGLGVYVRRDDERDAVVAEHRLVETADLDPRLWRSMKLTLTDPAVAHAISSGEWALERAHGWRVIRPAQLRAADAKVDALVQALERARAVREIAPPPHARADGLVLALDGTVQARLGGPCDAAGETLVARADGAWLCFRGSDLDLVRAPAATFYERRLFPLRLDDVRAIDAGPLSLRRDNGMWRIIAPPAAVGPASDEKVRAWLEPLLAADARAFSPAPVTAGVRVHLGTNDEDLSAVVADDRARRAGETLTLELAQPLAPSTDPASLREPRDLSAP